MVKTHMSVEKLEQKPHYTGHRDRLRERFLRAPDALPDYELLELLLFMAITRRDVKSISKTLIARFHNLAGVMNASRAGLEGIVHNHLIVSSVGVTSFKSLGLM